MVSLKSGCELEFTLHCVGTLLAIRPFIIRLRRKLPREIFCQQSLFDTERGSILVEADVDRIPILVSKVPTLRTFLHRRRNEFSLVVVKTNAPRSVFVVFGLELSDPIATKAVVVAVRVDFDSPRIGALAAVATFSI